MSDSTSQTQHPDDAGSSDIPGRLDFGSICADHGCNKVHPAENHDTYVARYRHSADCQVCTDYDASLRLAADAGLNQYGHIPADKRAAHIAGLAAIDGLTRWGKRS